MRKEYDFSQAFRGRMIPYNNGKSMKVIYRGELNQENDKRIKAEMEKAAYVWYASGYNLETREREHCFDIKVKPNFEPIKGGKK